MTIVPVELATVQQTLSDMQGAAGTLTPPSPMSAGDESFATTLAQATSDLSATDAYSYAGALRDANAISSPGYKTLFGEALNGGEGPLGVTAGAFSGSPSGESDLISLLLSAQQGNGANGVSSAEGVAATDEGSSANGLGRTGAVTGQDVVNEASRLEGTPYVWGGTTPQGFDCSGFAQYVYGQLGVDLPRTSEEQASVGTPVASLADARPGDLILFAGSDGTSSSPGHVGIYVGNGEMIDAPHTGTTVQEQSVSSAGPVVAIRRVLSGASPSSDQVMGNVKVPAQYVSTIRQAAANNNIPASLLAAVISRESGFNPAAVSSAGAQGIAQFMPTTAAGMGINPDDPTQAINGAAKLLGSYATRFGSYADAVAAYNAGPTAVERYGGIPPYAETQAYVPAVLSSAGLSGNAVVSA